MRGGSPPRPRDRKKIVDGNFPVGHAFMPTRMASRDRITSPFAPDLGDVRAWLEEAIAALRFVDLVAAVVALVTRLRDLNTDLVAQLAQLRRARPRSETLRRLEGQLVPTHRRRHGARARAPA